MASIFCVEPTAPSIALLLASLLQLGCAEGGCESASYLWLSALGNAAAAAALALLS